VPCKLLPAGSGAAGAPAEIEIEFILALKSDIWFNNFPDNQLTKFRAFYDYKTFKVEKAFVKSLPLPSLPLSLYGGGDVGAI